MEAPKVLRYASARGVAGGGGQDEWGKLKCFERDEYVSKGHLDYPLAFCHPKKMEIYCGFQGRLRLNNSQNWKSVLGVTVQSLSCCNLSSLAITPTVKELVEGRL